MKEPFSPLRIISGIIIILLSFLLLYQVLTTISSNNRFTFFLGVFSFGILLGFGTWAISHYPLKAFLEPLLIIILWTFIVFLPIWLSSLPKDVLPLILGFSPFLALLLWILYITLKEKLTGKRKTYKW
jgi:hypothetical protein